MEVGPGKELTVRICLDRESLVELLSLFFSKGDERHAQRFRELFGRAGEVSLILSTKRAGA
jgi:hypothetical protein